jgi:hypothetical protein
MERHIERQRTVAERDRMIRTDPRGELALEHPAFIARPVIDPV